MKAVQRYATYWAEKVSPEWDDESADYFRQLAAELRLLWFGHDPRRVLDLGCGSGELYSLLGFDRADYRGVDFSQSMLDTFASRHPDVDVRCADASTYRDDARYDLIFSHGLVQYFDPRALDAHLGNARAMMRGDDERSLLVCGSVPWRALYNRFAAGHAISALRRREWKEAFLTPFTGAGCGYWYSRGTFEKLARRHGLATRFYGSMLFPYRFHAVLSVI